MERLFEAAIPLVAILTIFGIPIIAILTSHQRKMAELIHGKSGEKAGMNMEPLLREIQALRGEVQDLKGRLDDQTILVDELRSSGYVSGGGRTLGENDLGERMKENL